MVEVTGNGKAIIVQLAHGYRIDVYARFPLTGEVRRSDPVHYPTLELARQFAELMAKATGITVEERLRTPRP